MEYVYLQAIGMIFLNLPCWKLYFFQHILTVYELAALGHHSGLVASAAGPRLELRFDLKQHFPSGLPQS